MVRFHDDDVGSFSVKLRKNKTKIYFIEMSIRNWFLGSRSLAWESGTPKWRNERYISRERIFNGIKKMILN